jgi:hypothetical protein
LPTGPFSDQARYLRALRKYQKIRRSLTAAGFKIKQKDADVIRRLLQPWQTRSYTYYDLLGEIKYAAQFYARALAMLRLYPAEKDDDGDWVETDDPQAIAQLERIQDPGGGTSGLLSSYGRLMFLAGEAYLLVTRDRDTDMEQWEMLSSDELRPTGSGYMRYKAPSLIVETYKEASDDDFEPLDEDTAVAYRLWKRHPRYSYWADATMQGVLDICEELILLTQAVRARARSRLAGSGILFIPEEMSPPPPEPIGDEDPLEDPFISDLEEAMMSPITDEGSSAAIVPHVLRVAGDYIEKVKHLQIIDPTQFYPETGLREECIKRLALGLDMPAEILTGMGDINHWGVWGVDEHAWKAHLQPIAMQLVDDLTASFYRPSLAADGVTDPERFAIRYDATQVINHPDRGKDAKDLYDRRAIGKRALREATGFDEEDEPTGEELYEMLGVQTRDASLAVYGIPSVKGGGIEPVPGELETGTGTEGAQTGAEVEKGPPEKPEEEEDAESITGALNGHSTLARILGASDATIYRARELAGARLKSYAKRNPELLKLLDGVNARDVGWKLGRAAVESLNCPSEQELVKGAAACLPEILKRWHVDETLVGELAAIIETHAAKTLYDEHVPPLPAAFQNYILGRTVKA